MKKCRVIKEKRPDSVIQLLVKTIAISAILLLTAVLLIPGTVLAEGGFAGGSGTEGDPWLIETPEQLATVAEAVYFGSHFKLNTNIDLSEYLSEDGDGSNGGAGWKPIGTQTEPFTGSFDGGEEGYTITGLYINRPGTLHVGMFGYTGDSAEIRNLRLENVDVVGNGYVGCITGLNLGDIENSYATGDVEGIFYVGGLAGLVDNVNSVTSNSYTMVDVVGEDDVGGLTGMNLGTIENSCAAGIVEGHMSVGGLTGSSGGIITGSSAAGDVFGSDEGEYIGGLVGYSWGAIENSYAAGEVCGITNVGGLVGLNGGVDGGIIENSYATGAVEGNEYVGGLVGADCNSSTIFNSYAVGAVIGDNFCGGLAGENSASSFVNSYYDYETTCREQGVGTGDDSGVTDLTTAEMKHQDSFEDWDFSNTWSIAGGTYPYLKWQTDNLDYAPPVFTVDYPKIENISYEGMDILVQVDEDATAYYVILAHGADEPDAAQVKAGMDSENTVLAENLKGSIVGLSAGTDGTAAITGLTPGTEYDIYVVAEDTAGNMQPDGNVALAEAGTGLMPTGDVDFDLTIPDPEAAGNSIAVDQFFPKSVDVNTVIGIESVVITGTKTGEQSVTVGGADADKVTAAGEATEPAYTVDTSAIAATGGTYEFTLTVSEAGKADIIYNVTVTAVLPDTTSPVPGSDGTITVSNVAHSSLELSWAAAADDVTVQQNLQYKVVCSESDNIDTAINAEANGTIVKDWMSGLTDTEASGLSAETIYYFNVIVRDEAGNKAVYAMKSQAAAAVGEPFTGGTGDPETPYLVTNPLQLNNIKNYLDKHFILAADIDLSEYLSEEGDGWNDGAGWKPIGTEASPFTGSFNGGEEGYAINSLYINRPMTDNVGIFGYTGEDAEIRNLRLGDVYVTGFRSVGSIAGLNRGTIENSSAAGDLDGIYEVGGLVGYNEITGSISYSYTMADVTGSSSMGGLVGMNTAGTIKNSYATGNVTGNDDIGGLVGRNYVYGHVEDSITTITDSYAEGDMKGDDYVGGLVGSNDNKSTIENSYATGNVTGNDYVGGLAGSNNGTITDSHATGDVEEGDDYVGGLVGRNSNTITDSYAAGAVEGNDYTGGLVGRNVGTGTVANSYAAGIVKGINWVGGLVGWIEDGSTVTDSYAAGDVEGIYSVGGLAAWIEDTGTIADSYAAGFVKGIQMVGGLVGCNLSIIENSYYDYETTCRENGVGMGDGTGVTGLSTADMKRKASFDSWDFSEPGIWRNIEDCTYPVFQWQSWTTEEINAMISMDKGALEIIFAAGDSAVGVTRSLTLPEEGANGTTISWSSDDTSIIANDGTVILPADENKTVILTATISKSGGTNQIKAFTLTVIKKTLESIAITTPAVKLTYMVGEALDISGLVITGTYDNGSTAVLPITTANISGFDSSEVSASLTLTVTVEGKTASYDIAIVPAVTYNVTYDANGGTGAAPMESNKAAGAVFAAADNSFTAPVGKQFKEWNTSADGTGAGYEEGAAIIMPANNLILYAVWEVIPYVPSGNADLSGLVISAGTLSPAFEENITSYSVSVGSSVSSIEITPTLADSKAAVNVNGIEVADGNTKSVSLNTGDNTITLVVTAENGTTSRTYTIIVNRASSSGDKGSRGGGETKIPAQAPAPTTIVDSSGNITTVPKLDRNTGAAAVSIDTATLTKAFEKSVVSSDGKKTVEIEIHTVENASAYMLALPASALSSSGTDRQLKIKSSIASVILPGNMLAGIAGDNVKEAAITIGEGDKSLLPDDVKAALGDRPLVQLSLTLDGEKADWNNPDAAVTVSIPYKPTAQELADPEHITVWYIDGSGNVVEVPSGRYNPETGMVTFSTIHFSNFAVAYVTKAFNDLGSAAWAKKQVEVLASKGILKGITEKEYTPQTNITRAEFLYSLIRTLGVDAKVDGSFDDIGREAYYYKEIAVAKKLGITGGTGNNKFTPDAGITRQDMMVLTERALRMLKKLEAQGRASDLDRFADKTLIADYATDSIASVVREGLMVGSGDRINPLGNTTRAEAAVFLYRIYNEF